MTWQRLYIHTQNGLAAGLLGLGGGDGSGGRGVGDTNHRRRRTVLVHNFNALVIRRTVLHYMSVAYWLFTGQCKSIADQRKLGLLNISAWKHPSVAICVGDELMRLISTYQTIYVRELRLGLGG